MMDTTDQRCPAWKDGFAWHEKLLVRVGVAGLLGVGVIGIYLESLAAAVGYLLFALAGGLFLVYDSLCVYCPYPYEYSDCLFFPHQLVSRVVKRRTGRIHWIRKAVLLLTAAGLVLIPQYWLWRHWGLLASFWILVAAIGLTFGLYYCRRCRHGLCALNRATKPAARQAANIPE
jgi:hypothetical protein